MESITVQLDTFQKLRKFVSDCTGVDAKLELVSGQSVADAKSIMGILALDLTKPLELRVKTKNGRFGEIFEVLREYQV